MQGDLARGPEDLGHLELAAGWWQGLVVLPYDRRRHRCGAALVIFLLPGVRAVRLCRSAHT
jgi:hypothetical protein